MSKKNYIKKLICLALIISISLLPTLVFAVYSSSYDSLSFTQTNNSYIYSNNPEKIYSSYLKNGIGAYTIKVQLEANKSYDVEYSHANYTGVPLTLAVILTNKGPGDATITKMNNWSAANRSYYVIGSEVETEYWSNAKYSTKDLNAGTSEIYLRSDLNSANASAGVGKILLKANTSNVECKVVIFKTGTSLATVLGLPVFDCMNTGSSNGSGTGKATGTGLYGHDGRMATFDYNTSVYKSFYLDCFSDYVSKYNENEFEAPDQYLPYSGWQSNAPQVSPRPPVSPGLLQGSYGIMYNIIMKNAANKTLYLVPDWDNITYNNYQFYTIRDPYTSSWKTVSVQKPGYISIKLPNSTSFGFNWVLAADDCGMLYCTFNKPTTGTAYPAN